MAEQDPQDLVLDNEAEEALSLCDLPEDHDFSVNTPPPPRSSSDLFEFFTGGDLAASKMCPAEDIIFCGKLVPFKDCSPSPPPQPPVAASKAERRQSALRKRSESLSELPSRVAMSRSNSTARDGIVMRNSRSLDYRKLQRSPTSAVSPVPVMRRDSSGKNSEGFDKKPASAAKPRWYLLMFGMVKLPPEMELRDIKSRQFRRSPSVLFPPAESDASHFRSSLAGKSSWGFLRALSCKGHTSVAVTTSFGRMSQV